MGQRVKQIFKTGLSYVSQSVIGYIVFGLLSAGLVGLGGVYLPLKKIWLWSKPIVQFPVPLWATILLILVCCLIVYLITRSYASQNHKPRIKLSRTAIDILIHFSEEYDLRFSTKSLSAQFMITFHEAQLAIDQLLEHDLLWPENESLGDQKYFLTPEGRKFLNKKNLL